MHLILTGALVIVILLAFVYLAITFKERFFLIGVFATTLIMTVLCVYLTFRELRFSSDTSKIPEPVFTDSAKKSETSDSTFSEESSSEKALSAYLAGKNDLPAHTQPIKTDQPKSLPQPAAFQEPKSQQEFEKILQSSQRDFYLIECISRKNKYCYYALQKLVHLKLKHLTPDLKKIADKHKKIIPSDEYFLVQILRSLWSLDSRAFDEHDKSWLKKRGIVLK